MATVPATLQSYPLGRNNYFLNPLGEVSPSKRSLWIICRPTKREKSSVLAYLNKINRAVNEKEISETLDMDCFILGTILSDFERDGYAKVAKSPLIFPRKATITKKIGAALSYSAQGAYYEITEKGKSQKI